MKKVLTVLVVVLGLVLSLSLAYAQETKAAAKPAAKATLDRLEGVVQSMNKDASTISVKDHRSGVIRQVVYSANTKFTKLNKPGASLDDIKEGTRVIVLGKFDDKQRLDAHRIDIRLPK